MKTIRFEITENDGEEIISCFTNNQWDVLSEDKTDEYIEQIKDILNVGYPKKEKGNKNDK